jgi:uncharacterized membrane protein HdeD (DUF308 family)
MEIHIQGVIENFWRKKMKKETKYKKKIRLFVGYTKFGIGMALITSSLIKSDLIATIIGMILFLFGAWDLSN